MVPAIDNQVPPSRHNMNCFPLNFPARTHTHIRSLPVKLFSKLFTVACSTFSSLTMPTNVEKPVLKFCKLSANAYAPTKGSEFAAGFDLRSAYEYEIAAGGKGLVLTDIQIMVPVGCYGRVAPRSGLAWKNHIDVGAGVIDIDYRGNVGVVLFNHGSEPFTVKPGDRVAQLICEKIEYPELEEVKLLTETERGAGGFGSTGVH